MHFSMCDLLDSDNAPGHGVRAGPDSRTSLRHCQKGKNALSLHDFHSSMTLGSESTFLTNYNNFTFAFGVRK